jgi:hypothetical protein
MDVLAELFTTFIGLLSLSVIVFIIGMAVFFVVWFMRLSKPPLDEKATVHAEAAAPKDRQ